MMYTLMYSLVHSLFQTYSLVEEAMLELFWRYQRRQSRGGDRRDNCMTQCKLTRDLCRNMANIQSKFQCGG